MQQATFTDSHDGDLAILQVTFDIAREFVTCSDGCTFGDEQVQQRQANCLAAADQRDVGTLKLVTIVLQQANAGEWRGRVQGGLRRGFGNGVAWGEAIDVLKCVDGADDPLNIDATRQWHLNHDAVDQRIGVQRFDAANELMRVARLWQANNLEFDAKALCCAPLLCSIDAGSGIIADEQRNQLGLNATSLPCRGLSGNVFTERQCDRPTK
ncbi:Beta-ketoacyl synthase [Alicyclobacillus hesperidum URH17-3-68]|nr:Beta-ketoacyl synthase [Alicyclobacillus hesperidum URH17-3-68]